MSNNEATLDSCFFLRVQCAVEYGPWLTTWLVERGFTAVEERVVDPGIHVLVYDACRAPLERALQALLVADVPTGLELVAPGCVCIESLNSNWRLAWTDYLKPVRLTENWTVVPRAAPNPRLAGEMYLEPALAFGFGEHPSTTRIAPWLETACRQAVQPRVLDVGCGTGVLSLLAAASGAFCVVGVDTSEDAVKAASLNARNNGLEGKTQFVLGSADAPEGQFDIVCANIESGILTALASDISSKVAKGGRLVLAGLLREQEAEVIANYRRHGLELSGCESYPCSAELDWSLLASLPKR